MRRDPESIKNAIEDQYSRTSPLSSNYVKLKRRDLLDLLIYVGHLEHETKRLRDEASD